MRGLADAYRRVLRNTNLTRLLAGEFVSSIGDWLYLVAILVLLYERTEDAVLLGIVGAVRVLPYMVLSIPAGFAADRFDRRRILIATDVARGLLMLVMAVLVASGADIVAIIAVALAATCFSAFFGPAIGAYLPSLIRDESDLGPANTAFATLNEVTTIIGPAVAAIVVVSLDLSVAFVLNAISFGLVAIVLWTLPSTGRAVAAMDDDEAPAGSGFHWREAIRPLSALAVMDGASSFVYGGLSVLTVVIAYDQLGSGEAGTGLLNAAVGVGGVLGSVVTGALVLRRRLGPPILLGAAVLGLGLVVLGLSGSLLVSVVAMAAASAGALLTEVIYTTLLQRIAPDDVRGRAFGVMDTVDVVLFAAGSFLIPAATVAFGIAPVLIASGVGVVIVISVSTVLLGDWATQAPPEDAVRSRLSRVPAVAGLPPARLEAAERRAAVQPMVAGEVVVAQGDEADRFYVIAAGSVEVTQVAPGVSEPVVLRQMGEGEAFGEIGILSGVPRTATVTATTDGTLLALDKQAFLDLVSESPELDFPVYDPYMGRAPARVPRREVGIAPIA